MKTLVAMAVVLALASGCAVKGSTPKDGNTIYDVTLQIDGTFSLPETDLGSFQVPTGTTGPADLLIGIGGAYLKTLKDIKAGSCVIGPSAKVTKGSAIVVTALATCTYKNTPITESIKVTATPEA